jgi:hypothetical protein
LRGTHLFTINLKTDSLTHNAPFLPTLTHTCQWKSDDEAGIYWKVIHNLKTALKLQQRIPRDDLKLPG